MEAHRAVDGRGRFITLEGGEGAGKSTLVSGLRGALEQRGINYIVTREPGGTPLAEQVRALALTPPEGETWSPLAHALLMNTARQDHLEKLIRPALAAGTWVICDRFADSTLAYQSVDGVRLDTLIRLQEVVVGDTRPDLTFILDAAPEALLARRQQRAMSDVFEARDLDFHQQIRAAFLDIARRDPDRCVIIDALKPPSAVLTAALDAIDAHLARS